MTKQGNQDKKLKEAITLGKKNKALIPLVRNWCSNIQIDDISGGLVAQMYNLPINLGISCPHTTDGFQAMNFEWIARDFIINNCQSCTFHNEVHNSNFGRETIEKYKEYQEKLKKAEKEELEKKQKLKEQVDVLIAKEKSRAEVTELSILKLIQSIETDSGPINIAKQILEASKLSPNFFGNIVLDYLSLFFDNEEIGVETSQTVQNILQNGKKLSLFGSKRLEIAIERGTHIDANVGVLRFVIDKDKFNDFESLLNKIITLLWYKRNVGDSYDSRPSYPNSIALLVEVHKYNPNLLFKLLDERLKINDKVTRINTNYLLQELIITNPDSVNLHCDNIIKSLELEDDEYEESADTITCSTLSKLYKHNQELVMSKVNLLFSTLTDGAKVEFLHFYKIILLEDNFISKSKKDAVSIVELLLKLIFIKQKTKELKEEVLQVLEDISVKRPMLLLDSFDSLIGLLIEQFKAFKTFNYYLSELKNPQGKTSTFNPLQHKNYWEVESEEMEIKRGINKMESIIEYLISSDISGQSYKKIINIILGLKSSTDGFLKSQLVAIIRKSVKNPMQLAEQLPSIYGFLLDTDSSDVRYEAMNFVNYLIENQKQLVTKTLINTIKVFMNDTDRSIKGKAIEAFGSIIKKFPKDVEEEQIQIILKSVVDSYVVIHKRAVRLAYKIFPFLNEIQKTTLIRSIIVLENSYNKEKDFEYCKELVNILLFLTKENPKFYSKIVYDYVTKYCNSGDYYIDLDSIKKLSSIRSQNEEFNILWLEQSVGFLSRTQPNYHNPSFDTRRDLLTTFYKISKQDIINQLEKIKELATQKLNEKHFIDVFELLSILSYFRLYEEAQELSIYFDKNVQQTKSNEAMIARNKLWRKIIDLELKVEKQQIDKHFINSLNIDET